MKHETIISELLKNGFESGWVVRGEKIVIWENSDAIPEKLATSVELDITEE